LPVNVGTDPGDLKRGELDVAWAEGGLPQRIALYVEADDTSWWINEVRAYDNVGPLPDWAFLGGPLARQPLGVPFRGDLDLEGPSKMHPVRARLQMTGVAVLFAGPAHPTFVEPPGGGAPLKADPFGVGGPLRCSGILQLAPVDAERELLSRGLRISWRFFSKTGPNSGFSDLRLSAPGTGWIMETEIGSSGELIVFVADPAAPMGKPVPVPPDCSALPSG